LAIARMQIHTAHKVTKTIDVVPDSNNNVKDHLVNVVSVMNAVNATNVAATNKTEIMPVATNVIIINKVNVQNVMNVLREQNVLSMLLMLRRIRIRIHMRTRIEKISNKCKPMLRKLNFQAMK